MVEVALRYKEKFHRVLDDYKISDESARKLAGVRLAIFSGLTSSGRNTVIDRLVETSLYYFLVSDTTRPPKIRDGKLEQDGVAYNFKTEEEMLQGLKNGELIEAEIIHERQVSGMSIREVLKAADLNKIAVTELEYRGANNIAKVSSHAVMIGLIPPSYDEWMRRLTSRDKIDDLELRDRMHTARLVLENLLSNSRYRIVVNDDLGTTVSDVRNLIERGIFSEKDREFGEQTALSILESMRMSGF